MELRQAIYKPYRKYKNVKVEADGIKFASKLERSLYLIIKQLNIKFTIQPKYTLFDKFRLNGKCFREIYYKGDFDLYIKDNIYTLDAKGKETDVFKIKKKLFAFRYQKEIICIKSIKQFNEWYRGVI
jgi:hypothetical protein